jgi:hypothetical protein
MAQRLAVVIQLRCVFVNRLHGIDVAQARARAASWSFITAPYPDAPRRPAG